MGGGNLAHQSKKKGFAISGILYPLLILTLFLVVQMLFMLQTRKNVLDKARTQLADSINGANIIYTNEELTSLLVEYKDNTDKKITELENKNKTLTTELNTLKSTVTNVTTDSGWKTLVSGINYRKVGSIVFVEFINYKPPTTNWQTVGTLPAGYRTSQIRYGSSIAFNGTTGNDIMVSINSSGVLQIYVNKIESLVGMFVFPIN